MAAEPQPSSLCLTYGTSSHTPELFAGATWADSAGKKPSKKAKNTWSIEVFRSASRPQRRTATNAITNTAMMMMISRSRSDRLPARPAAKLFCIWRERAASFVKSSSLS